MRTQRRAHRGVLVLLVSAVAAALLTGLTTGPAAARAVEVTDPRGDMWETIYNDGDGAEDVRRPARRNADITSFRVDHRAHRLALTTRMVELDLDGLFDVTVIHRLRRPNGRELQLTVVVEPRRTLVSLHGSEGATVRCPDIATAVDRRAATVRVTVPRRCLGRPAWVKASSRTTTETERAQYFTDVWGSTRIRPAVVLTRRVPAA